MDLAGINFSDFAITCSIYFKMCDIFVLAAKILAKMGQLANFTKLSMRKQ